MKSSICKGLFLIAFVTLVSCETKKENNLSQQIPIVGTWKLFKGIVINKADTIITDYTQGTSFIKVINNTHFAFLHHDLEKGKGTAAVFGSGGGSYLLRDSLYTEHLEYCSDRAWEGNDFTFTVRITNDTLIQSGIEKVEGTNIDRINIEKYVRVK